MRNCDNGNGSTNQFCKRIESSPGAALKKEFNACALAMDLPPEHDLRKQLEAKKDIFANKLEEHLDCNSMD